MRHLSLLLLIFITASKPIQFKTDFDANFESNALRINLAFAGNKDSQEIYLFSLNKDEFYGGSQNCLIDTLNLGTYRCNVFNLNKELLFRRGFCSLFEEWQTTEEAKNQRKVFNQSINIPYPKNNCIITIDRRNFEGIFEEALRLEIDPDNPNIAATQASEIPHKTILKNGTAKNKIDLLFLSEGYKADEMGKFVEDVKRLSNYLFSFDPYQSFRASFNISALCIPSQESGVSDPQKGEWKNTALKSSFNTFYIDRYLQIADPLTLANYASQLPYDHLIVVVNSKKYGGGGIYNHFSIVTADHKLSEEVFLHELGHGIAGLADEYYTSEVPYENYFNLNIEPWQPNITTLIDFEQKWKHLVPDTIPIPTPNNITVPIGVYEGASYLKKGVYRPAFDCRMKTNEAEGFCPVCQEAIKKVIQQCAN